MALSSVSLFLLLLLISSFLISEARPLNVAESHAFGDKETEVLFDGFYIKSGGPSSGGKGHQFPSAQSLGGIKNSGPSTPGQGHFYTTGSSRTLGGIKHSGPSTPGQGHYYASSAPRTLGGIKHSGPSPGQGN
ncbi:hypothetical protein MANES_05G178101v8 [Manihot esculenta]|uniref:Uncharacterized protein n=2 Tax=Manihot esculenta TaxID=3983 RepID=A0ACB7HRL0_MANES|nr:hypothetical protein MANES_05G178101v8 [Manihot esculenta]